MASRKIRVKCPLRNFFESLKGHCTAVYEPIGEYKKLTNPKTKMHVQGARKTQAPRASYYASSTVAPASS
ncbi:MAG: hypothetical protein ACO3FJ_08465, partial [Ilumatobacteraceae bacterium]